MMLFFASPLAAFQAAVNASTSKSFDFEYCVYLCRRTGLTPEQFRQQYELQNRPVVMTDKMTDWPAIDKWNRHYVAAALAGRPVSRFWRRNDCW